MVQQVRQAGAAVIPGTLPAETTVANAGTVYARPFEYRCMICGAWHPFPHPCPKASANAEAVDD